MLARDRKFIDGPRRVRLEEIDAAVAARLGPARVKGNAQPAAFNRQIAMYLAMQLAGWSTTRIGKFYNGRHHTTVCYAIQRIAAIRETNARFDAFLTELSREILASSASSSAAVRPRKWCLPNTLIVEDLLERLADSLVERITSKMTQARSPGTPIPTPPIEIP